MATIKLHFPQQTAHFTPQDDPDLPFGQWWVYPAGAHITFFQGALSVLVLKNRATARWEAVVRHHRAGALSLHHGVRNDKLIAVTSRQRAMYLAEQWLLQEVALITYWLPTERVVVRALPVRSL